MTLFEKAYITTKEKTLWEELLKAQKEYGIENPFVNTLRTKWNAVYEICEYLFPEYRVKAIPGE